MSDTDRAKQCFIELVGGAERHPDARQLWDGMQRKGLGTLAAAVCEEIRPVVNDRISITGQPMDLVAPSAWHAGCLMMVLWLHQTVHRIPVASIEPLFESFFAMRGVFRGQTRPWSIRPTQWRRPLTEDDSNGVRLKALHDFLISQMEKSGAIELDILGKIRDQIDANAIAQHYGFPTTLVDFAWDPLTALYFACSKSDADVCHRPGLPSQSTPHAAVYCTSFLKLASTGSINVRFPPIQLQRLYRQRGLFVDYGSRPPSHNMEPRQCGFTEPWMWVEQNCAMVLFPSDEHAAAMHAILTQREMLPNSDYLLDVVTQLDFIPTVAASECPLGLQLGLRTQTRPPWRMSELDVFSLIYTDDEFRAIASVLLDYLQFAAMVNVNGHMRLDPLITGKLTDWDERLLTAIREISTIPFMDAHVIAATQMIRDALGEHVRWRDTEARPES